MPSVEIICIGQLEPTLFDGMPFQIDAENTLVSQRSPTPLFQPDFDKLSGCIYHLVKQSRGAYTAGDLLDEWWEAIQFKAEYVPHVQFILNSLLSSSPQSKILFTSDYQFGPDAKRYQRPIRISRFWALHQAGKLWANALNWLIEDKSTSSDIDRY